MLKNFADKIKTKVISPLIKTVGGFTEDFVIAYEGFLGFFNF